MVADPLTLGEIPSSLAAVKHYHQMVSGIYRVGHTRFIFTIGGTGLGGPNGGGRFILFIK